MSIEHKNIFESIIRDKQTITNEDVLRNKEEYLRAQEQIKERVNNEIEKILIDSLNMG